MEGGDGKKREECGEKVGTAMVSVLMETGEESEKYGESSSAEMSMVSPNINKEKGE